MNLKEREREICRFIALHLLTVHILGFLLITGFNLSTQNGFNNQSNQPPTFGPLESLRKDCIVVIHNLLCAQRVMERLKAENKMKLLTSFHWLGSLLGFWFLGWEQRSKIMACAWDGSLQQHLTETSTASVFISSIPRLSLPSQHFNASLACSPMLRPF